MITKKERKELEVLLVPLMNQLTKNKTITKASLAWHTDTGIFIEINIKPPVKE